MSRDIVLVTVECLRRDRAELLSPDLGEVHDCITAGHYTRPALAGVLSGDLTAAVKTQCQRPTLATVLQDAGYATIGVTHSPQTAAELGFHDGFERMYHDAGESEGRGSQWREWLGQFRAVRAVHRRLRPKAATLANIADDETAVRQALRAYHDAPKPRLLWVHLMGSHRPYGRGSEALPTDISRRAAAASETRLTPSLSPSEQECIIDHYDESIKRVGSYVRRIVNGIDDDAAVIVCGDHGEELGEDGRWFHAPYCRRTVGALTTVPLWSRGLDIDSNLVRQIDIAPALVNVADVSGPWRRDQLGAAPCALTVAHWAGTINLRYQTPTASVTISGGDAESIENAGVSRDVESQLRALGYT